MDNLKNYLSKFARWLLINLGIVLTSLPVFAVSMLLTLSLAFWLYDRASQGELLHVSRRVLLIFSVPGCLGSLALNGFVIYRLSRFFEERFKEN
jgi:hypothetical protein